MEPKTCKHKTHALYADATEGFYIQTWLAERELRDTIDGVVMSPPFATDSREYGNRLVFKVDRIVLVEERLAHGRRELALASANVDRHLASGRCPNLPAEAVAS